MYGKIYPVKNQTKPRSLLNMYTVVSLVLSILCQKLWLEIDSTCIVQVEVTVRRYR